MGKEAAFNGVELRAVAGVVGHSDFDSQVVDKVLQVLFEKTLGRRIAVTVATSAGRDGGSAARTGGAR
jgi:hypothetical protein